MIEHTGVQLSVAETAMAGMTSWQLAFNGTVTRLVGQLITGGVVSTTVTVWLQKLVLPQASAAIHVRVAQKLPPQMGLVTVFTMVTTMLLGEQLSVATGTSKSHTLPH